MESKQEEEVGCWEVVIRKRKAAGGEAKPAVAEKGYYETFYFAEPQPLQGSAQLIVGAAVSSWEWEHKMKQKHSVLAPVTSVLGSRYLAKTKDEYVVNVQVSKI